MARVSMDADGKKASDGNFPLATPGEYLIRVEKVDDGFTSKEAKNPECQKVDLLFSIWEADEKVGSCFHTLTFIPDGRPGHGMWLHANKALGLPWDGQLDYDTDDYMGASCRAEVIIDTYNNKKKNKIDKFLVPDAAQGDAQEPPAETKEPPPADNPATGSDAIDECPV